PLTTSFFILENTNPPTPLIPLNLSRDQAMIDLHLKNVVHNQPIMTPPASLDHQLDDLIYPYNFLELNDLEPDLEFEDVPLVSPFIDFDEELDDGDLIDDILDGVWHSKIELIDPDGEKFERVFRTMSTTRKLSKKDNLSDNLDLDHLHDS
ncbi:hypothetical protein Tco_0632734, partial [Tanacetum coccineum]